MNSSCLFIWRGICYFCYFCLLRIMMACVCYGVMIFLFFFFSFSFSFARCILDFVLFVDFCSGTLL